MGRIETEDLVSKDWKTRNGADKILDPNVLIGSGENVFSFKEL